MTQSEKKNPRAANDHVPPAVGSTGRVPDAVTKVTTEAGEARITLHRGPSPRLLLALGHGAGGGIEARDLQALAAALPGSGVAVALVEQPWRVAGKKVAPAPRTLDTGWRGIWPVLAAEDLPVVAGGRSAGARVACRTAVELGAAAVLALSFPLHPSPSSRLRSSRGGPNGKPEKSRAEELLGAATLPVLVVQGGNDPFGRPEEFPGRGGEEEGPSGGRCLTEGDVTYELTEVPYADHGFAVPRRAPAGQEESLAALTGAVTRWAESLHAG